MAVVAGPGLVFARIAREWSDLGTFYAGVAGVVVLVVGIGLPWIELAPDGDLRRRAVRPDRRSRGNACQTAGRDGAAHRYPRTFGAAPSACSTPAWAG